MIEYEILHYPGNVTGSDDAQPGRLLGINEMGFPWEVLDAEYDPEADRTTVQLQTAQPDTMRRAYDEFIREQMSPTGQFPAIFQAA